MILGPNGSGKSSLLKIIGGELKPKNGQITYDLKDIASYSKESLARIRAVMSQQPELNFPLTAEEVILMGRYPHFHIAPKKRDLDIVEEVMQRMNLSPFRNRNYLSLSGGERQRVQFARVMAQVWERPLEGIRCLLLDEPLNSLDINYQHEFLRVASGLLDNDTVIVAIVHDLNLALQYADNLLFLKEGQLMAQGSPKSVLNESLLENIFGLQARITENPLDQSPMVVFPK
jgi:iron complex transport system ATP-binding protein